MNKWRVLLALSLLCAAAVAEMTTNDLRQLVLAIDPQARQEGEQLYFTIEEQKLSLVYSENFDRMRLLAPVKPTSELAPGEAERLLQANFDSVLDTRYAIARGYVWATYIHPISPLTDRQFLSAVGQTVNAVRSYGTTFSSGELMFGGGDSNDVLQRELIERLLRLERQRKSI